MEVYLEIEDRQYGKMIAELFENLSRGCSYELLNFKKEVLEASKIIKRNINHIGDNLSDEEVKLLNENGFDIRRNAI